jgi:hypothetical protein
MRSAYPAVFFCTLACASAPSATRLSTTGVQSASTSVPVAGPQPSGRGQLLTGSFLTEYFPGENLADVLRRRAPLYLRPRSNAVSDSYGRTDPIAVYINGSFSGNLDVLTSIPAYEVFAVDRMSASEATIKFGPRHGSGALMITLVRHH